VSWPTEKVFPTVNDLPTVTPSTLGGTTTVGVTTTEVLCREESCAAAGPGADSIIGVAAGASAAGRSAGRGSAVLGSASRGCAFRVSPLSAVSLGWGAVRGRWLARASSGEAITSMTARAAKARWGVIE
jgi:hypothetical protein